MAAYRDSILNGRAFHFLLDVVHEDAAKLLHVMLREKYGVGCIALESRE